MTTTTARYVIRGNDDAPTPIKGRIIGWEDEDRVVIAWGDEMYADEPKVRIEWMDELTIAFGRR